MKPSLKATLYEAISEWLARVDDHDDRPPGLACDDLESMMTDAAAAVYDASHAGAVKQEEETIDD